MMSTAATVRALKEAGEDFEFYPSTDEIIRQVTDDLLTEVDEYRDNKLGTVLDIGAGDGRVLVAMRKALEDQQVFVECFAIEKAIHHLSNMPKQITVIGTDFEQQSLADKQVGAVFCNPPYSEFEEWTLKILREASAR